MLLNKVNNLFHELEISLCILKGEVRSKQDQRLIGLKSLCEVAQAILELLYHIANAPVSTRELVIKIVFLPVERTLVYVARGLIVPVQGVGKDRVVVGVLTTRDTFESRLPNELYLLFFYKNVSLFIIHAGKCNRFKPHSGKKLRSRCRVAKRIQVPRMLRGYSKGLFEEGMTCKDVVDDLLVSRTGFIARGPSSIYKLELALSYKLLNIFPHLFVLILPPFGEIVDLCLCKAPRFIVL
jgi:hypothetical protein